MSTHKLLLFTPTHRGTFIRLKLQMLQIKDNVESSKPDYLYLLQCDSNELINHITLTMLSFPSTNSPCDDALANLAVTGWGFRGVLVCTACVWA